MRYTQRLLMVIPACAAASFQALAQTPVGTSLTFQGQLIENGQPANAEYDFQFRLFDAASGGTAISQVLSAGDVPVESGVFSRELDFVPMPNETLFDGDNRWIEVYVRPGNSNGAYTTLSPRQKLTAAPYAVYALGGPGGGDGFWAANGNDIYNTNGSSRIGIRTTTPAAMIDINCQGIITNGMKMVHPGQSTGELYFGGPGRVPGISAIGNNGNRRDLRFGDQGIFLVADDSPNQPDWTQGLFVGENGLCGIGTYEPTAQLEIDGQASASLGLVVNHPGSSTGRIEIGGPTGSPGIATFANNGNRRDIRFTDLGMFLLVNSSAERPGATRGIFIEETGDVGIGTISPTEQLTVVADGGGAFRAVATTQAAVIGNSDSGFGVFGSSTTGRAGYFLIPNPNSSEHALVGETHGTGVAVHGHTYGNGYAGYFVNRSNSNSRPALYCRTDGTGLALQADGIARVDVLEIVGADLAEKFPVDSPECAVPGTVMEIDPAVPGRLRVADSEYSPRVAGVVSGANDLSVGAVLGNLPGHEDAPPIALSGRVWVLCDATSGPIEPGNLLTTSNTPGHAMKAADRDRAYGAIIGKAMSSLKDGKGLVLVLVSLQ